MNNDPDEPKRCPDCEQFKPSSEYWRNTATPDGLYVYGKECGRARNRQAADRRRQQSPPANPRRARQAESLPEGMKRCLDCERVLPLELFVRNRSTRDGRTPYCRPCQYARAAASRKRLHGGSRHYHLLRRYGIGASAVQEMLADQGGRCLICSVALGDAKAHVDHDHVTGVVRGILCFNCNGGLGQFKEDAHLLRDAADYIDASSVIAPHGVSAGAARLISMGLLPVSAISETRRAEV